MSISISIPMNLAIQLQNRAHDSGDSMSTAIVKLLCNALGIPHVDALAGSRRRLVQTVSHSLGSGGLFNKPLPRNLQDFQNDPVFALETYQRITALRYWYDGLDDQLRQIPKTPMTEYEYNIVNEAGKVHAVHGLRVPEGYAAYPAHYPRPIAIPTYTKK